MALFLVEIPDLNGMSKKHTAQYIREAVSSWAGGCSPDHPFFGHFHERGNLKVTVLTAYEHLRVERMRQEKKNTIGHNPRFS